MYIFAPLSPPLSLSLSLSLTLSPLTHTLPPWNSETARSFGGSHIMYWSRIFLQAAPGSGADACVTMCLYEFRAPQWAASKVQRCMCGESVHVSCYT